MDDLTGLSIYLVGPTETPFESGVFHISLRIPSTYPQEPPKANFATKIFHPNVDDRTGDVCVDTLKRDWNPKLTLHDVLVTIRCLLVYPNPTSSLNEAAGKLLLEDYDGFARHARLMAEVHAAVPDELKELVEETRSRKAVDDDEQEPARKLLDSSICANTASKPASSSRHKRQGSKLSGTTIVRKTKRTASPAAKATVDPGSDSDSDGGDSGKENVVTRPRPISPAGVKRPREESAAPAEENEKGDAEKDTSEASGRKSPKLKEELKTNAAPKERSASAKPKAKKKIISGGKPTQKKSAPKIGLRRF
jgi:ubiquitin-conjugating enzyme E2 S